MAEKNLSKKTPQQPTDHLSKKNTEYGDYKPSELVYADLHDLCLILMPSGCLTDRYSTMENTAEPGINGFLLSNHSIILTSFTA